MIQIQCSRWGKGTDVLWCTGDRAVDEAHCCDTSRSLPLLIRQHSKGTSREQGYNPALVKQLLYRSDMLIQHPTELASLACTLWYLQNAYWVPNTHSHKMRIAWQSTMHTEVKEQETDQTSPNYRATGFTAVLWTPAMMSEPCCRLSFTRLTTYKCRIFPNPELMDTSVTDRHGVCHISASELQNAHNHNPVS